MLGVSLANLTYSVSSQIELSLIIVLVVSGLNLSLGYVGQFSFGQEAMYAAGACTAGLISKGGVSDLLVEQSVDVAAKLAGRLTVLELGRVVIDVQASELENFDAVKEACMGPEKDATAEPQPPGSDARQATDP